MNITRRTAVKVLAGAAPALLLNRHLRAEAGLEIAKGPFAGTKESLAQYAIPNWYNDAKFGIWAHWGPQSGLERGDWYARNMYVQGHPQYNYHVEHFGHPSKVGYKDLCHLWKGAEFDPEYLIRLYKQAGAKYFVSMGVHSDNFDLWNSKYSRWNAVKIGPERDIVGLWRAAALKNGLKFGVSEHVWISYKWFAVSHGCDTTGPLAGVPYDGTNPAYADLYHDSGCAPWAHDGKPSVPFYFSFALDDQGIPESCKRNWFLRVRDLIDNYQPDYMSTDGALTFENYGYSAVADLYNQSARVHGGQVQAVFTSKGLEDCLQGTCVLDIERGMADEIQPVPWESATCIGQWHYSREIYEKHGYKSPKTVIDMLVDIVSRNGNLLLNFPLPNSGRLDPDELDILAAITGWMRVNAEGIHGTRPWKISGEGPTTQRAKKDLAFNEGGRKPLTAQDVRFTTRKNTLYAFVMGWPQQAIVVRALGTHSPQSPPKILNVEMLGHGGRLTWAQEPAGLRVELPAEKLSDLALALKVDFA